MRLLVFTFLLMTSSLSNTAWANFCAPPADESDIVSALTEVNQNAEKAKLLHDKLVNTTLSADESEQELAEITSQLDKHKIAIQNVAARLTINEAQSLITLYMGTVKNAAASALLLSHGKNELYTQKYWLSFPKDLYANFAFDENKADRFVGLYSYVGDTNVAVTLNADQKYFAEAHATAKPIKPLAAKGVYFRTLKCVINRLSLQKKIGLSEFTGEPMSLPFALDTRACHRLNFQDIMPHVRTQYSDSRRFAIGNLLPTSTMMLNEEKVQRLKELTAQTPFLINDMYILSVDDASAEFFAQQQEAGFLDIINEFDAIVTEAENKLIQRAPFLEKLADTLTDLTLEHLERTVSCKLNRQQAVEGSETGETYTLNGFYNENMKQPYRKLIRRFYLSLFPTFVQMNGLISFSSEEKFKDSLKQSMVSASLRIAEVSAGFLETWGVNTTDEKPHFINNLKKTFLPAVKAALPSIDGYHTFLQAAHELGHIKFEGQLLDKDPTLLETAIEANRITLTRTKPKDLDFDTAVLGKVFNGSITSLPTKMRYYVEQMLTRSSWQAQKTVWGRYKAEMQTDITAGKYQCEEVGMLASIGSFFSNIGTEMRLGRHQGNEAHALQNGCYFVHLFAKHLGLENNREPEKLGDVWQSFTDNYDRGDYEVFLKNYKNYLASKLIYAYPVLGIKMSDLETRLKYASHWRVFNYLGRDTIKLRKRSQGLSTTGIPRTTYSYTTHPITNNSKNNILKKAFKEVEKNIDNDLKLVANARKLEDLNKFIEFGNGISTILGSEKINAYLPTLFGEAEDDNQAAQSTFSAVYQTHTNYQNTLIRDNHIAYRINEESVSRAFVPMYWLGAAALVRGIATRITGRFALGNSLYYLGSSMTSVTRGYFGMMNFLFAAGTYNQHSWEKAITNEMRLIEDLKNSNYIVYEDSLPPLLSYQDYIAQKIDKEAARSDVRFQKYMYGAFTAFSIGTSLLEPIMLARASARARGPAPTSLVKPDPYKVTRTMRATQSTRLSWAGRGLDREIVRLSVPLKRLGNPKYMSVRSLRAGRDASTHKGAQQAYERVIFQLGQRAQQLVGKPKLEKMMIEKWFGHASRRGDLDRLLHEYSRLYPDMITGVVR